MCVCTSTSSISKETNGQLNTKNYLKMFYLSDVQFCKRVENMFVCVRVCMCCCCCWCAYACVTNGHVIMRHMNMYKSSMCKLRPLWLAAVLRVIFFNIICKNILNFFFKFISACLFLNSFLNF